MNLNKFDIVLVDFPFSDLTMTKRRPAIIIKELEGENLILAQITTKRRKIAKYEVSLDKTDCDGNIKFNSFIYIDMIFTLHNSLIHAKIGGLINEKIKKEISEKLRNMLD